MDFRNPVSFPATLIVPSSYYRTDGKRNEHDAWVDPLLCVELAAHYSPPTRDILVKSSQLEASTTAKELRGKLSKSLMAMVGEVAELLPAMTKLGDALDNEHNNVLVCDELGLVILYRRKVMGETPWSIYSTQNLDYPLLKGDRIFLVI